MQVSLMNRSLQKKGIFRFFRFSDRLRKKSIDCFKPTWTNRMLLTSRKKSGQSQIIHKTSEWSNH